MKVPAGFSESLASLAVRTRRAHLPHSTSFCRLISALIAAVWVVTAACSTKKNVVGVPAKHDTQSTDSAAPGGPEAKIRISYSRPGDFLTSMIVTEYSSAETVLSGPDRDLSKSSYR
jgi:hypothetical protein